MGQDYKYAFITYIEKRLQNLVYNEAVLAILTQYATPLTFWLTGWAFYNLKNIFLIVKVV